MKPRGSLMLEHRLIEKVLLLAKTKAKSLNEENFDPIFVDNIVDFIVTYADRTHHGKEEGILFEELESKSMSESDQKVMLELIDEHKQARVKVKEIISLNEEFKGGKRNIVPNLVKIINWLQEFYPVHIKKEDAVFFPNTEVYFTKDELTDILNRFNEFDQKMIHEKYQKLFGLLEKG